MSAVMQEHVLTRPGDRGDVFRILQMSLQFWPQTGYDIPADEDSIINMIVRCMDQGLMTVLEVDGAVVGFLAGLKFPCIANESVILGSEIAYWIDPEHRGNGGVLLDAAEVAAKQAGVDIWTMIALENMDPERVEQMYLSRGYHKTERAVSKRLN